MSDNTGKERLEARIQEFMRNPEEYETNRDLAFEMLQNNFTIIPAEKHLVTALSFGKNDLDTPRLMAGLAEVRQYQGDFNGAIQILSQLSGQDPDWLPHLGEAFNWAGRLDDASRVFGLLLDFFHENAKIEARARRGPVVQVVHPWNILCIRFGEMASKLDIYAKARIFGLTPEVTAILPAPSDLVINQYLLDCWRRTIGRFVSIVSDEREIEVYTENFNSVHLFVDWYRMADGRMLYRDLAYVLVQRRWEAEGRPPLLTVPRNDVEEGWRILSRLGMPDGAWFAALHVRGSGFHDDYDDKEVPWDHNALRNSDIADYIEAIEAVTSRGGWVIRIGDPSMPPLPPMDRVIDYTHSDVRSARMDLFCITQARFLIGTNSGPTDVAWASGVPLVATNWFPLGYWPFSGNDIFVPKRLRRRDDGRDFTAAESVRPPLPGMHIPDYYARNGIEVVPNAPGEIAEAVFEMVDRLDGARPYSAEEERMQEAFRAQADFAGVGINSRIGTDFLRRHGFLIENTPTPS